MKKYASCLLLGVILFGGEMAYAQNEALSDGVAETIVVYKKPPTRKLAPELRTYDVRCTSNFNLTPFNVMEGQLSAKLKFGNLQRVPENGDLHLTVLVGDAQGPRTLKPKMVNTSDNVVEVQAPISVPLYYKLTDAKGMIYEEDSATSSNFTTYSVAFRTHTNVEGEVTSHTNNILLQTHTKTALDLNLDWINYVLNEQFFGGTKRINTRFFYLNRAPKYGIDGQDHTQADSVIMALNQFSHDQDFTALQPVVEHAAAYWEIELSKLNEATPNLKNHDERYHMLYLKYDLYYNLALAYLWLKDSQRSGYYLDRCHLLKERDELTADADRNYQDVTPVM